MRLMILASALWLSGCAMWINNEEFGWEMGASANATRTIERREYELPDGTIIIETGIEEEAAENAGMSENAKDAIAVPFKLIVPLAKAAAGAP